jgi:signal transduction histidine kinase
MFCPEERDRLIANFQARLVGEDPGTQEYRALRSDGTEFPVLFHASSILTGGELAGLRGVIVDLSERKRIEKERARIEEQYHQAQTAESIGRLAGGVAHDLNNLLSPVIGYGEILQDELGPVDARRDAVGQILQAGFRARDLVRQLLAFSRRQTMEYKAVDLNSALSSFEKLLRRTMREDIELRVVLSPDIPAIMADIGQVEQVIMNLAVNAADAMPEGGTLTIETASVELDDEYEALHQDVKPGSYVMLAVKDTGTGMDQETIGHIFEPFFSTKDEQSTGLGLATVYGIVKQHGGSIRVYSEPGEGTTFTVYLPVSEGTPVDETATREAPGPATGLETILLVEDDAQVRELTQTILERQGYAVLVAENGPEALALLNARSEPVHLLLTDVDMTEMSGKELAIAAAEGHPEMKALYMSGYAEDIIAHRGALEDGIAFISKPFTIQALATRMREVLDRE